MVYFMKEAHAHMRESMESMSAFFLGFSFSLFLPLFVRQFSRYSTNHSVQDGSSAPCVKESAGDRQNGTHGEDEMVNITLTDKIQRQS